MTIAATQPERSRGGGGDAADAARLGLLRALADPTRYRIFVMLLRGETCNCELAERLGLTSNLVSHHLGQLRAAGLVREHRDPSDARGLHLTIDAVGLAAARASLLRLLDLGTSSEPAPPRCVGREARSRRTKCSVCGEYVPNRSGPTADDEVLCVPCAVHGQEGPCPSHSHTKGGT